MTRQGRRRRSHGCCTPRARHDDRQPAPSGRCDRRGRNRAA
jgi:hypothetical protein